MSGSSFAYVYLKRSEELLAKQDMVDRMSDAIRELAPYSDAWRHTEQINMLLVQAQALLNMADHILDQGLAEVWHDMEWWYSADMSKGDALEAIVKYSERERSSWKPFTQKK